MSPQIITQKVDWPPPADNESWPPPVDRERMEAARRWRTNRILRFSERQDRERSRYLSDATKNRDLSFWINFKELAEQYGRNVGVSEGFQQLQAAILAGEFEQDGRCRVLYLHPAVTKTKMTRGWLEDIIEVFAKQPATIERQYLGCCWVPRAMALAWSNSRNVNSNAKRPTRRGRPKGFSPIDDSAALAGMRRLIAKFPNMSHRAAAREVMGAMRVRGHSREADIDRWRKKLAKGHTR